MDGIQIVRGYRYVQQAELGDERSTTNFSMPIHHHSYYQEKLKTAKHLPKIYTLSSSRNYQVAARSVENNVLAKATHL